MDDIQSNHIPRKEIPCHSSKLKDLEREQASHENKHEMDDAIQAQCAKERDNRLEYVADEIKNMASELERLPSIIASVFRENRNRIVSSARHISTEIDGRPFLQTNAYKTIVGQLKRSNTLVVTGLPKNGKKFIAFQCAKTFQEEKQMKPFIVQHHQDWQLDIFPDSNLFIIVQDFCEVDIFSSEFLKNVKNHIAGISFSIHDKCTPEANKLIIILRKEVLHFMNRLFPKDIRFTEEFVIDLSSQKMRLTSKEKQELVRLNDVGKVEDESTLMESEFPFGFPNNFHFSQTISEFSEHVDAILSERFERIEPEFFIALAVICLRGGKMKLKELYENETYQILHSAFKQTTPRCARDVCTNLPFVVDLLTDVYFRKVTENDTTYVEYLHRSVKENVASVILRTNAGLVFQLAPLNRLQYFRSKLLQVNTGFSTNAIFDWIIERITSEICIDATESVMQCIIELPEWGDENFINMILAYEKIGEACRDLKTYQQENFLVCAIKWKSVNIVRLLFHWLGKKLFLKYCQENKILMKVVETGSVQMFQLLNDLGVTLKDNKFLHFETLFTAVKNNHLPMLSFLTQHVQIDSSFKDAHGYSLLHYAAKSGSMDVVEYLIGQGLDPNVCSVDNETILHLVAMSSCFPEFKGLCERFPGLIGTETNTRKSVLHYAAANKDANILKFLIENMKMNPFDITKKGETVLHIACSSGSNDVVRHILEHHPDIIGVQDEYGMTAAHAACASGNLESMELLSQFDELFKISSKEGESLLHCASMSGSLETLRYVLNLTSHLKEAVTAKGYSLLQTCISSPKGNLDTMQYLIDLGFDVRQRTEEGQTTLHLACISGNLRLVRFLFIRFPELIQAKDDNGYDAILSSAKGRSLETLKYLDDMQCFTRQTLTDGKGILHIACKHSSVDLVRYLCHKYPKELERRDSEGKTALHMSAMNASLNIIQYLLGIEVDHYAVTTSKQTILHLACYNSNSDILKYISEKLPDLKSRKDCRGYNALHCSCEARNERAMKFLLNEFNGFDVHQRTFENFTPLGIVFVNSTYRYEERTVNAIKTITDVYKEEDCSASLPEIVLRDISQYQESFLKSLHACDYLDLAVYRKGIRGKSESEMLVFCLLIADSLDNENNLNNHAKIEKIVCCQLFHFAKYEKHHQCTFPERLIEIGLTWSMDWCVKIAFLFPKEITDAFLRSSIEILKSGVSSDVVKAFARGISKTFLMKYGDVLSIHTVWVGFLPVSLGKYDNCIDTIVVITINKNEEMQRSLKEYHGLKIYFRDVMHFSPEAKEMLRLETDTLCDPQLKKEDIQGLMKLHSNILLVSISSVKSIGYGTPNQQTLKHLKSVVIYCRVKGIIPAGETLFPTYFGGYPVDVRESAVTLAVGQEGSKMGDRVGLTEGSKTGTLGGFVDIDDDRKGFITCAHVLTSFDGQTYNVRNRKPRVSVIDDRGTKHSIGRVDKFALDLDKADVDVTIDAALVEMQNRIPDSGHFTSNLRLSDIQQADFRNYDELSFADGETASIEECRSGMVLKVGAASGLTRGHVHFENAEAVIEEKSVVLNDKRHALRGQIEVRPYNSDYFIRDGDSGSFVFLIANGSPPVLKCVGLAVARTDHGTCLMTPIENVLSRFNLTIDQLSKFGNAPQEEDILSKMFQSLEKNMNDQFAATNVNMSAIRDTVERMENRLVEVESAVFNNPEDGRLNCTLL